MKYVLLELRQGLDGKFGPIRTEQVLGDRVEPKKGGNIPTGGPGFAFVYAPETEVEAYKERLLMYVQSDLESTIARNQELLQQIKCLREARPQEEKQD